jgi:hypothetical protein
VEADKVSASSALKLSAKGGSVPPNRAANLAAPNQEAAMVSGRFTPGSMNALQDHFLRHLKARIERHARIYFRHVRCHFKKEDAVADVLALAWKWFKELAHRGKDATRFVAALAKFAARAVRCGRRVTGQLKAKDVMNELTQQRHGFYISKLLDIATLSENPLAEALIENTQTEVPEQVHFRIDFPAWRRSRSRRDRRVIDDMALGERTLDLSRKHRLSPARISQLRREFRDDWRLFCGDRDE